MREEFEAEVRKWFDPARATELLARDDGGRYHEWGLMLAWECYQPAHESGRQLGISQERALWEMAKTSEVVERAPLTDEEAEAISVAAELQWSIQVGVHPSEALLAVRMTERRHGIGITPPPQASDQGLVDCGECRTQGCPSGKCRLGGEATKE